MRITYGPIELAQTCSACPEQYDVFLDKRLIGYLRLRHGHFTASYPDAKGAVVYEAETEGDGAFEDHERSFYLTEAVKSLFLKFFAETYKQIT